ncbi:MAG: glycosyltransferase [Lactobacillales bacterium]|jgi:glycosyltransferase EpsF|nr:glycosyltransferase [Lactobacillales bacterium]
MKRVLQVFDASDTTIENILIEWERHVDSSQIEFEYAILEPSGENVSRLDIETTAKVSHLSRIDTMKSRAFIQYIRTYLRKNGPFDSIHVHTYYRSGLVLFAAYLEKVPIRITHAHYESNVSEISEKKKIYTHSMKWLINKYSTKLISTSKKSGQLLFGSKNFEVKCHVIPEGMDAFKLVNMKREENRSKRMIEIQALESKSVEGMRFLLEVMAELKRQRREFNLSLVGSENLSQLLLPEVKRLGLEKFVQFRLSQPSVTEVYENVDIVLLPKDLATYELPLSIVAAQASGANCLVTENYPEEADLELGMIHVMSQVKDAKLWAKKILQVSSVQVPEPDERIFALTKHKYEIGVATEEVMKLYVEVQG